MFVNNDGISIYLFVYVFIFVKCFINVLKIQTEMFEKYVVLMSNH